MSGNIKNKNKRIGCCVTSLDQHFNPQNTIKYSVYDHLKERKAERL